MAQRVQMELLGIWPTQARLALQRGAYEQVECALEDALTLSRAMPYPYAEAKALYVYGLLHMQKGEPEQACENTRLRERSAPGSANGSMPSALSRPWQLCQGNHDPLYTSSESAASSRESILPWSAISSGTSSGRRAQKNSKRIGSMGMPTEGCVSQCRQVAEGGSSQRR